MTREKVLKIATNLVTRLDFAANTVSNGHYNSYSEVPEPKYEMDFVFSTLKSEELLSMEKIARGVIRELENYEDATCRKYAGLLASLPEVFKRSTITCEK